MRAAPILLSVVSLSQAFIAPKSAFTSVSSRTPSKPTALFAHDSHEPDNNALSLPSVASATAALWSLTATVASADSPDWGIFEGRTGSLLHPIMMASLLALSVSTALLGFNWRRQRTIGDDISALKKTLPDLGGASSVKEAVAAAKSAESVDFQLVNKLESALSVQEDIDALTAERKELSQGNNRDRHFSQGALLAFLGTAFAIEVRNDDSGTQKESSCFNVRLGRDQQS
jgi:hypothetical protein